MKCKFWWEKENKKLITMHIKGLNVYKIIDGSHLKKRTLKK